MHFIKIVVSLPQKIIKTGNKTYKKLVIKPEKNKTGKINARLSKNLEKGMKVTVKISKKGYKAKTKIIKVK